MSSRSPAPVRLCDFYYGWDLLYATINRDVNKKSDLLVALAHFSLTKHCSFRCVGLGDDRTMSEEDSGSELLPDNWNADDAKYSLRYMHDKKLYLLLGHITEDALLLNLLDVSTRKVSNICVEPESLVVASTGSITTLMPKVSEIIDRYRQELLEPVFSGLTREVTTQTASVQPLRLEDILRNSDSRSFSLPSFEFRPYGFPEIGHVDLDPLGRSAPGSLFQFTSRPSMQRPPRFDPYGLFDTNPNIGLMRPPGHDDDYMYI